MTDRNDNTCYIERSKVREILIGHNAATQAVLSKIDVLTIFIAEDFQPLTGCQLRGPGECQKEGKCMSVACVHYNKTEYRPRMTLEAQVDGILYPGKET